MGSRVGWACFRKTKPYMPKIFDSRLAPYADQLKQMIVGHEALQQEYEEKRLVFNAQFRRMMFRTIRPVIQDVLDRAAKGGHWIEIHTLMDERYLLYLHQCYSIHWRTGGRADLAVVANFDYQKIVFIVEQGDKSSQLDLSEDQFRAEALSGWFQSLFPGL